jgi:hypothetical protein
VCSAAVNRERQMQRRVSCGKQKCNGCSNHSWQMYVRARAKLKSSSSCGNIVDALDVAVYSKLSCASRVRSTCNVSATVSAVNSQPTNTAARRRPATLRIADIPLQYTHSSAST